MAKTKKRKSEKERKFNSQLPVWIVEPGAKKGTLNITCPRDICGGKFIVERKRWCEGSERGFIGRSCPYCFYANRIPERYMTHKLLEELGRFDDD
jgi:hypothetical protein